MYSFFLNRIVHFDNQGIICVYTCRYTCSFRFEIYDSNFRVLECFISSLNLSLFKYLLFASMYELFFFSSPPQTKTKGIRTLYEHKIAILHHPTDHNLSCSPTPTTLRETKTSSAVSALLSFSTVGSPGQLGPDGGGSCSAQSAFRLRQQNS